MPQSKSISDADRLAGLPPLPRDEGGPVFAEPWQAQAFALAVKLSEQGHFTWKEWAAALAEELKAAADRGEPDDGSHYYEHWLATLERLVTEKTATAGMIAKLRASEQAAAGGVDVVIVDGRDLDAFSAAARGETPAGVTRIVPTPLGVRGA